MHFMLLIFVALLCLVVWGFFHSNPEGVPQGWLLVLNAAIVVFATLAGAAIGYLLYRDASVVKAGEKGLATYLGIMAGGTTALVLMIAGGLVRNLLVFPISKRAPIDPRP